MNNLSESLKIEKDIREGNYKPFLSYNESTIKMNKSYRASGDCICIICNQPYNKHNVNFDVFFYYDYWLVELCNGDLVHL